MITIFKTLFDTKTPYFISLKKSVERIKSGKSKDLVLKIRSEKNKSKRNEIKSSLPSILFSGKFTERNKRGLLQHSGCMVIDFDDIPNDESLNKTKMELISNKHVSVVFKSPSGNGLKAVVSIPKCNAIDHELYFKSFQEEFNYDYFDKSNCDVSRVCFESYDPDIYYDPKAVVYSPEIVDKGEDITKSIVYTPITDEHSIISKIMDWNWKYEMVDGQRNNFSFALARSFCEYGVSKQVSIDFIVNHFSEKGFSESEIKSTVNSAYRNSQFGIKQFKDYEKERVFNTDFNSISKNEFIEKYKINDDEYKKIASESDKFWYFETTQKGEKKVKVDLHSYKVFLEKNGFNKIYINGSVNPTFVKIESNVIVETSTEKIKDFVLDYLLGINEKMVWNYFAGYTAIFSENYLTMLNVVDLIMLKDEKDKSFIAYKNGILEVTKDKAELIDYIDVDGYIWKRNIVDRDFIKTNTTDNDYKTFVKNMGGGNPYYLENSIGYLLCRHKSKITPKAIIINDEKISDNPEGGTGKGLFITALGKIRNLGILDGKHHDPNKGFPYQTISQDTEIMIFDDVKKNWDFESFFSLITEGITLERKNKDAIKLSFEETPKIAISTNYVIKGRGNSHKRRRHEIEVAQYYNYERTPYSDFGKELFDEWDKHEFARFDNYMVSCMQNYLKDGLVEQKGAKNIHIRKFISATNSEFYQWCEEGNLPVNVRIYRAEKYAEFVSEYTDYGMGKFKLSQKSFKMYIDEWAKLNGYEVNNDRDQNGRYTELLDGTGEVETNDEIEF